ncbi:hypothetical protein HMPREF9130_1399 [Peptoniphilus sp. oral taxon 375 str. F0436]|nr:hypothetical protein HMPREF9130_1399 [Peptoniphilus sp. oral taxon 375 str. F0436]
MKTDKSFTEDKDFIFIDKFKDPVWVEFKEGQIHRVRPYKKSLVGNIYLGRVDHRVPQLKAYFLDLGQGQRGFLQEDLDLAKGDLVLVQVAKDAYSKKYPGLKTDLSIPGDRLVYFPQGKKLYYSLKNKKALKKFGRRPKKTYHREVGSFGPRPRTPKETWKKPKTSTGFGKGSSRKKDFPPRPSASIGKTRFQKDKGSIPTTPTWPGKWAGSMWKTPSTIWRTTDKSWKNSTRSRSPWREGASSGSKKPQP